MIYSTMLKYMGFFSADSRTNTSAFIVSWCRYFNDTGRLRSLVTELDTDPKDGFHDYKVDFVVKNEEATSVSIIFMMYLKNDLIDCD